MVKHHILASKKSVLLCLYIDVWRRKKGKVLLYSRRIPATAFSKRQALQGWGGGAAKQPWYFLGSGERVGAI